MPTLYKLFRKWVQLFKRENDERDVHPADLEDVFHEIGLVYSALTRIPSSRDIRWIRGVLGSIAWDNYPTENEKILRDVLQDNHYSERVLPDIVIEFARKRANVV